MKFVPVPDDAPMPEEWEWCDPLNSDSMLPEDILERGDVCLDLADYEHLILGLGDGEVCRGPLDMTQGADEDQLEKMMKWRARATATNRPRLTDDGEVM